MNAKLLGFFSGFPTRQFPASVASRLQDVLASRRNLVFISAWPSDFAQNDSDAAGMHAMFTQYAMGFDHFCVIDERTEATEAKQLIQNADCIFLMGGHATRQFRLILEKDILEDLQRSNAVLLGVSAGACNMAVRALDIWESPVPYAGLGLADITIKAHVSLNQTDLLQKLTRISIQHQLPVCAMEDESAIFVQDQRISCTGQIHFINQGELLPFSPALLANNENVFT